MDRLAPGASGRELFAAIILATFDALSAVLKCNEMTLSAFADPITEVSLYQSLLVNRVPLRRDLANIDSGSISHPTRTLFYSSRGAGILCAGGV